VENLIVLIFNICVESPIESVTTFEQQVATHLYSITWFVCRLCIGLMTLYQSSKICFKYRYERIKCHYICCCLLLLSFWVKDTNKALEDACSYSCVFMAWTMWLKCFQVTCLTCVQQMQQLHLWLRCRIIV